MKVWHNGKKAVALVEQTSNMEVELWISNVHSKNSGRIQAIIYLNNVEGHPVGMEIESTKEGSFITL